MGRVTPTTPQSPLHTPPGTGEEVVKQCFPNPPIRPRALDDGDGDVGDGHRDGVGHHPVEVRLKLPAAGGVGVGDRMWGTDRLRKCLTDP